MLIGDSFTFCFEAGDLEAWPHLLNEKAPDLNVINLGVSGYGLDQMYLTLVEEIDKYRPDLVIVAYIDDDLNRTLLSFRDYMKPRFCLKGDNLVLTNVPIGDPAEVYRRLESGETFELRSMKTLMALAERVRHPNSSSYGKVCLRLVKEMKAAAEARGAEFILMHLAWGGALNNLETPDVGESFLRACRGRIPGLSTLGTRGFFWAKRTETPWWQGHYTARECEVVSELVSQRIRTLTSWKRFQNRNRAQVAVAPPQSGSRTE
jgi:hypothetical protein